MKIQDVGKCRGCGSEHCMGECNRCRGCGAHYGHAAGCTVVKFYNNAVDKFIKQEEDKKKDNLRSIDGV